MSRRPVRRVWIARYPGGVCSVKSSSGRTYGTYRGRGALPKAKALLRRVLRRKRSRT